MTEAPPSSIQDRYPEDASHCYGCGTANPAGLHLASRWEGSEVVARFRPRREHTSLPGFVYGGLIASLIDCHAMATAAAYVERQEGGGGEAGELPRFVTAALKVDYLRPTPLGLELELRATVTESGRRKQIVDVRLLAGGNETARGTVVAVPMPSSMLPSPGHLGGTR